MDPCRATTTAVCISLFSLWLDFPSNTVQMQVVSPVATTHAKHHAAKYGCLVEVLRVKKGASGM